MNSNPNESTGNVSFLEATLVWARIGLLSFGGPAGQIALMHGELVEQRKWISESRYLHALNYCMLLPGPEAQQLAIYVGWLLHRTWGGVVAGVLFVLPGALVVFALSMLYVHYQQVPVIVALFFGLKSAVLAIVIDAVIRIGKRALRSALLVAIAAGAFAAIFAFDVPFPLIIVTVGTVGAISYKVNPRLFERPHVEKDTSSATTSVVDNLFARGQLDHTKPNTLRAIGIFFFWSTLWIAPIILLVLWRGTDNVFTKQAAFFSQTALVTVGGAYSVLSYVAQRAVEEFHWLQPGEMVDGLSLAETTPGPLILVLQFVGFVGAFRASTDLSPWLAGAIGASIALWTTFIPCFLWIFLGAPYIERLRNLRTLNAAMTCVTAAVVGVILNLSVWFGLHTLFRDIHLHTLGPLHFNFPDFATLNIPGFVLAVAALTAMLRFKFGIPLTLLCSALIGVAISRM